MQKQCVILCFLQSIPADMEFDPNSSPPCYKTKDEVSNLMVLPLIDCALCGNAYDSNAVYLCILF